MSESRCDLVGWALCGKVDMSLSLGNLADLLSSRDLLRGEGEEVSLIGEISGHHQLWSECGPPPSLPLARPFKTTCLVFEPSCYHGHKSVDPPSVLPKDCNLANKETVVRSFLYSLFMQLVVISI